MTAKQFNILLFNAFTAIAFSSTLNAPFPFCEFGWAVYVFSFSLIMVNSILVLFAVAAAILP